MILYIDESGNTGETLSKDSKFNFIEQPYYVLAGIFLDTKNQLDLESFITSKIVEYKIQGNELKAKNLYDSKPAFVAELANYLIDQNIPFFIELMDKLFYLHMHIVEYFIVPYYSVPLDNMNIMRKKFIASNLGEYLNPNIYQSFIDAVKENTNESLERFYEILIKHFEDLGYDEIKQNVEQTKLDYFEKKEENAEAALKEFFPLPDENPHNRLIHLLPNFSAFTGLIARAQKYKNEGSKNPEFEIIHDEQKQFDVIFHKALEQMKNVDSDKLIKYTTVANKSQFNVDKNLKLSFKDSKTDKLIQVSDLIAGITMRFWSDFMSNNDEKVKTYLPVIKKLSSSDRSSNVGINYVVPDFNHEKIFKLLQYCKK